ncbi:MAG: hypothetical protein WAO77_03055 [Sphingobium sp.]|uniref:hypothetical protein n=1 Tax=Sphingobium sp. TaxID=1912891 RepID=UPI003BB207E1
MMIGNRTRSNVARARYDRSAAAQNVAATAVRAASDAGVNGAAVVEVKDRLDEQETYLADLETRLGNLEDTP